MSDEETMDTHTHARIAYTHTRFTRRSQGVLATSARKTQKESNISVASLQSRVSTHARTHTHTHLVLNPPKKDRHVFYSLLSYFPSCVPHNHKKQELYNERVCMCEGEHVLCCVCVCVCARAGLRVHVRVGIFFFK